MRSKHALVVALFLGCFAGTAWSAGPDYEVDRGDTLWDLSGRFWSDVSAWPELWALNPHFRNPHWILPGDPIYLDKHARASMAQKSVVRIPLEKLVPAGETALREGDGSGASTGHDAEGRGSEARGPYLLTDRQGQDFVAPQRLPRWGEIRNQHQVKVYYGAGEDIEFTVDPDVGLRAGDLVTVIDDREAVSHPISGEPTGYYVQVLGHVEVLAVHGAKAVGRLVVTYDTVEDGDGVIAYRPPVREVAWKEGPEGLEGVILRGRRNQAMFATDDVVFLDRGAKHGLQPGTLLEINVREGERSAQGIVDLGTPLAQLLVVRVEDVSATGVVVESRAALEAGDRFITAAFSP